MEQEKECEFFSRMRSGRYQTYLASFALMAATKDCGTELIDLIEVKKRCNDVFRFLDLQRKFSELNKLAKIDFSHDGGYICDGFLVLGHKFDTLDEVERCIKNKAFI